MNSRTTSVLHQVPRYEAVHAPASQTLRTIAFGGEDSALAAGHEGESLRSEDSGRTWRRLTSPTPRSVNALSFDEPRMGPDGGHRWAASSQRRCGAKLANASATWPGKLHSISLHDSGFGVSGGQKGIVRTTLDWGSNWERVSWCRRTIRRVAAISRTKAWARSRQGPRERVSMQNAKRRSTCDGSKKLARGVTQRFCTMNGIVEPATSETVKKTIVNTGAARKPTIRVRLAEIGPYGLAVSMAARVAKKPPSESTNPPASRKI